MVATSGLFLAFLLLSVLGNFFNDCILHLSIKTNDTKSQHERNMEICIRFRNNGNTGNTARFNRHRFWKSNDINTKLKHDFSSDLQCDKPHTKQFRSSFERRNAQFHNIIDRLPKHDIHIHTNTRRRRSPNHLHKTMTQFGIDF